MRRTGVEMRNEWMRRTCVAKLHKDDKRKKKHDLCNILPVF